MNILTTFQRVPYLSLIIICCSVSTLYVIRLNYACSYLFLPIDSLPNGYSLSHHVLARKHIPSLLRICRHIKYLIAHFTTGFCNLFWCFSFSSSLGIETVLPKLDHFDTSLTLYFWTTLAYFLGHWSQKWFPIYFVIMLYWIPLSDSTLYIFLIVSFSSFICMPNITRCNCFVIY